MGDKILESSGAALPQGYAKFLAGLKERIRTARLKAALSANKELIILYWEIGRSILKRQRDEGWGTKVIDRLAHDLRQEFPDMKGFSARNLLFMRSFAEAFPDETIVKQIVSQIPWGHIIRLPQMVKDPTERIWYIQQTIEHGWSRNVLVHHYPLSPALPGEIKGSLPSVEELERELAE
ncbi:MAG: DUF1016 N-terminal domain-containing protein [Dehalococcoidia bacterium]